MIQTISEPLPITPIEKLGKTDKPSVLVMGGGAIAPGVITATVAIATGLIKQGIRPLGLVESWDGVKEEGKLGMVDFANVPPQVLADIYTDGGTVLGPGRSMLTRDEFIKMYRLRQSLGLLGAAVVGGDGTISGCQALQYSLAPDGQPVLNSVACVKTIDGDAEETLNIGFMTCAHEYARVVKSALREIPWENGVGIVSVYGRDNGHLALRASAMAAREGGPVITLLKEFPITREHLLRRIQELKAIHQHVCIVAAEGFAFLGEEPHIDPEKTDGAGNPKLLGCIKPLTDFIATHEGALGNPALRKLEPGVATRSCDPIEPDIRLARAAGEAVVDVIDRGGWGHVVDMQGTFRDGFGPVIEPLWRVHTGNPVTEDLYNSDTLQATPAYREHIAEQNPQFYPGNYGSLEDKKREHAALIAKIAGGSLVNRNGVLIPTWSIQDEPAGKELPTKWFPNVRNFLQS